MQNPEEIDNGSIESSQSEAQFHAPHTGPWGPPGIIAADGTLPRGLALGLGVQIPGLSPPPCAGRKKQEAQKCEPRLLHRTFPVVALSLPNANHAAKRPGKLCPQRREGEGARSHRALVSHGGHRGNHSPPTPAGQAAAPLSPGALAVPSCRGAPIAPGCTPGRPGLPGGRGCWSSRLVWGLSGFLSPAFPSPRESITFPLPRPRTPEILSARSGIYDESLCLSRPPILISQSHL